MATFFDILHVLTAVFIIGPLAILPHFAPRLVRNNQAQALGSIAGGVRFLGLLSLLVVVFGFGLMGVIAKDYDISYGATWIWLSVVLYAVAFIVALFMLVPKLQQAASAIESGQDAKGMIGSIVLSTNIVTISLIVVVLMMVWKP